MKNRIKEFRNLPNKKNCGVYKNQKYACDCKIVSKIATNNLTRTVYFMKYYVRDR